MFDETQQTSELRERNNSERPSRVLNHGRLDLAISLTIADLEHDWRDLEARADCTPFQTFDWVDSWYSCIGNREGVQPLIVTARDESDSLVALFPLAVERWALTRRLVFLGRDLSDYNAPLLRRDFNRFAAGGDFNRLWARILATLQATAAGRHHVVFLDKMPERVGDQANPFVSLPTFANENAAFSTRLDSDWTAFYTAKRSSATRRRDRTKRTRLGADAPVHVRHMETDTERARTLEVLFGQKQRSFARNGIPNLFELPGRKDFFRALSYRARSFIHVGRLDVGDECVAANLGIAFRDTYFHILASHTDGPLSRFGPGIVLLHEQMKFAIARGCGTFDFTIGGESYKLDWTDRKAPLHDHISAADWQGLMPSVALLAITRSRALVKSSPRLLSAGKAMRRVLLARGGSLVRDDAAEPA
ncbi:MAG: GNAT family N-acetyltransferase [Bauldia sp.]